MPISKELTYIENPYSVPQTNGYFNGYISNFRLTVGQALYRGNFTPPTVQLTNNTVGTVGPNVASTLTGEVKVLMFNTLGNVLINQTNYSNLQFNSNSISTTPTLAAVPNNTTYETDWINDLNRTQVVATFPEFVDPIVVGDVLRVEDSDTGFTANVTVTAVENNRITFNTPPGFPTDRIGGMTLVNVSTNVYKSSIDKPATNPFRYQEAGSPRRRLWLGSYVENKVLTKFFIDRAGGLPDAPVQISGRLETFVNPVVNGTAGDFRLPIVAQTLNTSTYTSYNFARDYIFDSDLSFTRPTFILTTDVMNIAANGIYTFTSPVAANVQFTMWGAGGGASAAGGSGGAGGFSTGWVNVNPGTTYYLVVGGRGGSGTSIGPAPRPGGAGGLGGGGRGGNGNSSSGGGGGYSGIFANSISQATAIMMAGGGGGGISATNALTGQTVIGGGGGGNAGQDGDSSRGGGAWPTNITEYGRGGTQLAGGSGGSGVDVPGSPGSVLTGGAGGNFNSQGGGGGGGGYFGGGGGAGGLHTVGAGGGGSGYLHPNLVTAGNTIVGNLSIAGNAFDVRRAGAGSPSTDGRIIVSVASISSMPNRTISFPVQDKIPFRVNSNVRIYNSLTRSKVEATVLAADQGSVTVSDNSVVTVNSQSSTLFIESADTSVFSYNEIIPTFGTNSSLPRDRLWWAQNFPSKYSSTPKIFTVDPTLSIGLKTTQSNLAVFTDQVLYLYEANKPLYTVTSQTYQTSNIVPQYLYDQDLVRTTTAIPQTASANITLFGQASYTTPGTYTWTAPAGVTSVSAVAVGGGGGSAAGASNNTAGGGGGGLGWKNNIPVTPGQTYTIVVGAGGTSSAVFTQAGNGGDSYFISNTTVAGFGGVGSNGGSGGAGGSYVGDGGGSGGLGGTSGTNAQAGGGGGAGGYAGNGGNGGGWSNYYGTGNGGAVTSGQGGGGGGGGAGDTTGAGGGGGGVGILGQGANGSAGIVALAGAGANGSYGQYGGAEGGGGGSGGTAGGHGRAGGTKLGGLYGGGAGSGSANGGGGAVRIIWGASRSFPATNTFNQPDLTVYFNNTDFPNARTPFPVGSTVVLYRNTPANLLTSRNLVTAYTATVAEATAWYVKIPLPADWDSSWQFYKIGKSTSDVYPKVAVNPTARPQNARENLFYGELAQGYRYSLSRDGGIGVAVNELPNTQGNWSGNTNNWFTNLSSNLTYRRLFYTQFSRNAPQAQSLNYFLDPIQAIYSSGALLNNTLITDVSNASLATVPSIYAIVNLQQGFRLILDVFSTSIEQYLTQIGKIYIPSPELRTDRVAVDFGLGTVKELNRIPLIGLYNDSYLQSVNKLATGIVHIAKGTDTETRFKVGQIRYLIGGKLGTYVAVGQDTRSVIIGLLGSKKQILASIPNQSTASAQFNLGIVNQLPYRLASDTIRLGTYKALFVSTMRDPSKYTTAGAFARLRITSSRVMDVTAAKKDPVSFWS